MAIAKADSLESVTLREYMNSVKAEFYSATEKSVHFSDKDQNYLGYVIRSTKNRLTVISLDQPILLDGKHGKDWLGVPSNLTWVKAE
jgi:hypothetical protein